MKIRSILSVIAILISQSYCTITQTGPNTFIAGIPSAKFQFFANGQQCPEWCWVASIKMVLDFRGLYVDQNSIATRIYGAPVCRSATPDAVLAALSGWELYSCGTTFQISANPYILSDRKIILDLGAENPIIVGIVTHSGSGHAVVLTAVQYHYDLNNNPVIEAATIMDPWPLYPSKQEILWPDLQQITTFAAEVNANF